MSYQWTFEGTNLPAATNAFLTVSNAQFSDSGDYGLVVTNSNGASTNPIATVQVVPLLIITQPQNAAGPVGTNLSFSVGVASLLPLTYQWFFNATQLPGTTNAVLPLENIQATNAGYYEVVAGTIYGTATSSPATLGVLGIPISFAANGGGLLLSNGQFSLTVTGLTGQGSVVILASTNLTAWYPLFTNPPAFGQFQFTDSSASNSPGRYYRAETIPPP